MVRTLGGITPFRSHAWNYWWLFQNAGVRKGSRVRWFEHWERMADVNTSLWEIVFMGTSLH